MSSPFIGRLQPLNVCAMLLYENEKKRYTVTQCMLEKSAAALANDPTCLALGLGILSIIVKTLEYDHPVPIVHAIALDTVDALKKPQTHEKKMLIAMGFYVRFFHELGLLPSSNGPSVPYGGENGRQGAWTKNASKLLTYLQKNPPTQTRRLKIDMSDLAPIIELIRTIANEHLPNAARGIDEVARLHASLA